MSDLVITKVTCDCSAEFTDWEHYKIHVFYNHPEREVSIQ